MYKSQNTETIISVEDQRPQQPNLLDPLFQSINFSSPTFLMFLATAIILLFAKTLQGNQTVLAHARFANPSEIRRGTKIGLKQIAKGKVGRAAFQLDNLVLADVQPAMAVIGRSGSGKTTSFINPALKNAIDQGWTNLVLDIKGEFMRSFTPYALAKGYEVYVYAPGFPYSDGLNFLEFMEDENDGKRAEEIATVLEANFGKPGERKDGFFSPQGVALLKLVFMMAKASAYPDMLSAWKVLSLPGLAKRLKAAKEFDYFQELGLSTWIKEAAATLRSMARSDRTVENIVGTSMTHFNRMIDSSIVPCFINHTIPLNLSGKQIVFFQIDEDAKSATAPLVAAAIHMLTIRNLNAKVNRTNTFGLFLDEFDSISLPDIKDFITKMRSYGLVAVLSFQSDAQVIFRYTRPYADAVLSSCGTMIYFDTGHHPTAEKVSKELGNKEVNFSTNSRSHSTQTSRSTTDHKQTVPLMTAQEINQQEEGCGLVINNPGFKKRPYKLKFAFDEKNDILWSKDYPEIWFKEIKPHREKKLKSMTPDVDASLANREVVADCNMPSPEAIAVMAKKKTNS